MTFLFFILNIIQATAEFLPISSSGHLIVVESMYTISEKGLEAFLHLPTALVIAIVFWKSFLKIIKNKKVWLSFILAILPAGLVGLLFGDIIDAIFYSPLVVGINLIFWGIILFVTSQRAKENTFKTTKWKDIPPSTALKVGLFQILALIPGTSRSGVTTLAGIWNGVEPKESAKFSFLAGFPLIAAASGLGFVKLFTQQHTNIFAEIPLIAVIAAMTLSLLIGIVLIKLFTSKQTLSIMKYSGIYRIILGIAILLWL